MILNEKISIFSRQISFVLILIASIGFMSQGLVNYYWKNLIIPPQVLLVFISFGFLLLSGKYKKKGYIPLMIGSVIMLCVLHHDFNKVVKLSNLLRFFQILTGIMIYFVVYHLSFYKRWLCNLLSTIFIMVIINSLTGIYEIISTSTMPWSCFHKTMIKTAVGLDWFPVALGYAISAPIAMAIIFSLTKKHSINKKFQILSIITSLSGIILLLLSLSRSAIIGVFASTIIYSFFHLNKKNYLIKLIILLLSIGVIFIIPFQTTYRKIIFSKDPRIVNTWITYVPIIIINPFAKSISDLNHTALNQFHDTYGIEIDKNIVNNALTIDSPHNALLSFGTRYGLIPFLLQLLFYYYFLINGYKTINNKKLNSNDSIMALATSAGILAFMIHAHFHNAGLFLGEMRNWIYFGILARFITFTKPPAISSK